MLKVVEEIVLIMLDAEKGDVHSSLSEHSHDIAIAGALLVDLEMEGRIDTDLQKLFIINPAPLGDDLLDPVLSDITQETGIHDTSYWITRISKRSGELRQRITDRLVAHGILEPEPNGLVFLSRSVARAHRYPDTVGSITENVELRIMRAILAEDIPDPRDVVIISIAAACGVFRSILTQEELDNAQPRIERIARLDLIGREVAAALSKIEAPAPPPAAARPYEEIPQASGWPIAGNALEMAGDLRKFLTKQYRTHGPIFRIRAFNRRFVALVGPEANLLVSKMGHNFLRSYEFWRDFNDANAAMHTILSMDGPEHIRMRKAQARGYSPSVLENNLDDAINIVRRAIADWPEDRAIAGQRAFQGIIAEQIGVRLTGVSPQPYMDDLIVYLETLLKTTVMGQWPKQMMYMPRYRRARKRILELYTQVLEEHQPGNRKCKSPDYIDDLIELNRSDPQLLPETDFLLAFLGPYIAGLDTSASVCSFTLYALLKYPDLLEQVTDEADALFRHGTPTMRDMRRLDATHRVVLEALRIYPIIPGITRVASNSFEFGGYKVPAGAWVLIGNTVPHHLPEFFPDPDRFDIERYRRVPPEHQRPGVYAPFGLGRHRCLGSSFAELQIMVNLATVVHETELVLENPNRPIKIKNTPIPHPDESFRFRLVGRRQKGS